MLVGSSTQHRKLLACCVNSSCQNSLVGKLNQTIESHPWRRRRLLANRNRAAVLDAASKKDTEVEEVEEDEFEDFETPDLDDMGITSQQVRDLMSVVCNETEFAEISLKVGSFVMKAKRLPAGTAQTQSQAVPAADSAVTTPPPPSSAKEQPFQSTASIDEAQILPPMPQPSSSAASMDEDDYDENLLYLGAPKVGILRRGRYVRGKKMGKGPVAEVGSRVKRGQPLAFIEQLGTYVPVEAPQAGEIASFRIEDGKAVEYKEVIVEIAPFFGGHIIGDKKYL